MPNNKIKVKDYYTITEAANILAVSPSTLRNYDSKGIFEPVRRMDGGKRLYSHEQLVEYLDKIRT